ncbi:1413_t:CDS:2 [Paraglomus occultum]|uniref:1413_t:CDS:1 n=1 Tax=Paraglomus occultum TaxID=144539 RepID=A0A9N9F7Y3_9GLOM|nr:1413_t:CDS:2 [Paraglomus occultum]
MSTKLNILHFNDVYHLKEQSREPVGGAARFATLLKEFRNSFDADTTLVTFGGDAFNPSVESSITKGLHMVAPLNSLGIDVACIGNHDFDFGVAVLRSHIAQTKFPWLLSNVVDPDTDKPLGGGKKFVVLNKSGLKIGFIGLVEKEWLETIPGLPPSKHIDFIQACKDLSAELRDPNGPHAVDLVIAITHSRLPNDIILARGCQDEIDLMLGGHDHFYYVGKGCEMKDGWTRQSIDGDQEDDGVKLVKSGTDFRELSIVECEIGESGGRKVIKKVEVTRKEVTRDVPPDAEMETTVEIATQEVSTVLAKPVAYTTTPWDCKSTTVRSSESAFGNFVADLMMYAYQSCLSYNIDCAILCGGSIRSDATYGPGVITLSDIREILPFEDTVVVIRITGQQIWDALESALSKIPKQEGRFPVVSGLKIEYDPSAPPEKRIRNLYLTERLPPTPSDDDDTSTSQGSLNIIGPVDVNQTYTVCTRHYLAQGYDGYSALNRPNTEYIVDDEAGIILSTIVHRYFIGLYYVNAMRFNKSFEERTRETVAKAVEKWKGLKKVKRERDSKGHLSRKSICDALALSCGEVVDIVPEAKDELDKESAGEDGFKREWVTVSPVIEGRIVAVTE